MALFIVVDGIDGSGKSTQIKKLAEWMRGLGRNVEITKEPGGTPVGEKIRSVLLSRDTRMQPDTEMLLFCADRAEHQHKVRKLLDEGVDVLCDRFLSSTWAYQIYGRKLNPELMEKVTEKTVHTCPDLTVILDLNVTEALRRAKERLKQDGKEFDEGRFEAENESFFHDVKEGFRWYAAEELFGEAVLLDASSTEDEIFKSLKKEISGLIK